MTLLDWIALALLGGVGAVLRYLVDGWVEGRYRGEFPLGTFAVNLVGCVMFGAIIAIVCCYKGMTASGGASGRTSNSRWKWWLVPWAKIPGCAAFTFRTLRSLLTGAPQVQVSRSAACPPTGE